MTDYQRKIADMEAKMDGPQAAQQTQQSQQSAEPQLTEHETFIRDFDNHAYSALIDEGKVDAEQGRKFLLWHYNEKQRLLLAGKIKPVKPEQK